MTPRAATSWPIAESISQVIGGFRPNETELSYRWPEPSFVNIKNFFMK